MGLAALLPFVVLPVASAQESGAVSTVRLAHLSPDTPPVDVTATYLDGPQRFAVDHVGYGAVSDYRPVQPGAWRIDFRPAGFSSDTPPVLSTVVQAEPAHLYTIAATGSQSDLQLQVLRDDPAAGASNGGQIRLINATPGQVEVAAPWSSGAVVAAGAAGSYVPLPAGPLTGTVTAAGATPAQLSGTITGRCSYTGIVLERNQQLSGQLVQDACGLAAVPSGAIPAGLGGAVLGPPGVPWPLIALLAGAGLLLSGLVLSWRTRSASR